MPGGAEGIRKIMEGKIITESEMILPYLILQVRIL
jgi:hypothetical protein